MPVFVQNDFTGGWNNVVSPDNMKDNELRQADNIRLSNRGGYKKRSGCQKINSVSYGNQVEQEIEWMLSDGSSKHLAMIGNSLCLVSDADGSATVKKASLNRALLGYFVYKDMFYFVDGLKYYVWGWYRFVSSNGTQNVAVDDIVKNTPASSGGGTINHYYKAKASHGSTNLSTENYANPARWDDVTDGIIPDDIREVVPNSDITNDLSPVKRCKYIIYHPASYRFFAAGDEQNPTALYFSEPDQPNYFKQTSVMYPVTELGPITAITNLVTSVLVSYTTSWRYWNGINIATASWKPIPVPYGCASHYSVALSSLGLIYFANEGICVMSPAILNLESAVMVVNSSLFRIITDGRLENVIDQVKFPENTRGVYHKGIYYFAYSDIDSDTRNNKILICDLTGSSLPFVRDTGKQVNWWCPRKDKCLYFASKNYILKSDVGKNDIDVNSGLQKAIRKEVKTKPYCPGGSRFLFNLKNCARLFFASLQSPNTSSIINDIYIISGYETKRLTAASLVLSNSFVWGDAWGKAWGISEFSTFEGPVEILGYRFQLHLIDESLDNDLFMYAVGFEFELNDLYGSQLSVPPLITDDYYS